MRSSSSRELITKILWATSLISRKKANGILCLNTAERETSESLKKSKVLDRVIGGRLPELFCKNMAYSIVSILDILHQKKIVHRDLKLENILINDNYDFKLADFGFSKDSDTEMMISFCGTPSAMAPEILKREPYDERCDTWSMGVMLYEMVYGKLPFVPNKKFGAGIFGLTNAVLQSEPVYDKNIEVSE